MGDLDLTAAREAARAALDQETEQRNSFVLGTVERDRYVDAVLRGAAPLIEAAVRARIESIAARCLVGHRDHVPGWDIRSPHDAGEPWRAYWMCVCGVGGWPEGATCAEAETRRAEEFAAHLAAQVVRGEG